jgi:glycosyltransferase involved in cell wall biosynthesis
VLLGELARRGWAVDLVSTPINYMTGETPPAYRRRWYVREDIDGIAHHWVRATGRIHESKRRRATNYVTFASNATLRALTLPRPDVILVSSPPLSAGAVGPAVGARHRRPWLLEVRDIWPESAASVGWLASDSAAYAGLLRAARWLTSSASAVLVPTPGLVAPVLGHGAREVSVITGVLTDSSVDEDSRRAARASLGVPDGHCLFLYVGSIGVANGLDALLDAVRLLPETLPATVLVVGDGGARGALEARIRAERLDRVRLLGAVPKDRVAALLAASDVCLHFLRPDPTFAAALPTKVLEYLGAHRPFVTNVEGLPRRLAERSCGSYAASPGELASVLALWTRLTPGERAARGEGAFAFGRQRFGREEVVDRLESALRRAIERAATEHSRPRPVSSVR